MKKKYLILYVVIASYLLTSCAFYTGGLNGSAAISSNNFKYLRPAKGTAKAIYLLGLGRLGRQALVAEAKKDLLDNNKLENGQVLANICVDFKYTIILIYFEVTVTVSADIIEYNSNITNTTGYSENQNQIIIENKTLENKNNEVKKNNKPITVITGNFTDERDNKIYKTIKIENQTWMAENLNYEINNSYCFNKDIHNCEIYGRLYKWDDAQNICPQGWQLPSKKDFEILLETIKKKEFMRYTDIFEYYGGIKVDNNFSELDNIGLYWSSTSSGSNAWSLLTNKTNNENTIIDYYKNIAFSVRCLKNE